MGLYVEFQGCDEKDGRKDLDLELMGDDVKTTSDAMSFEEILFPTNIQVLYSNSGIAHCKSKLSYLFGVVSPYRHQQAANNYVFNGTCLCMRAVIRDTLIAEGTFFG